MQKKGISLVALVITIIVLIIITGTVVLNIGGENSIINKAKEAVIRDRILQLQEQVVLIKMENKTAEQIGGTVKNYETIKSELLSKKLIREEDLVDDNEKTVTITVKEGETVVVSIIEGTILNRGGESVPEEPNQNVVGERVHFCILDGDVNELVASSVMGTLLSPEYAILSVPLNQVDWYSGVYGSGTTYGDLEDANGITMLDLNDILSLINEEPVSYPTTITASMFKDYSNGISLTYNVLANEVIKETVLDTSDNTEVYCINKIGDSLTIYKEIYFDSDEGEDVSYRFNNYNAILKDSNYIRNN